MEKTTNINIRIDEKLKKEAEILFKDLGLNMSSAINLFLKQAIRTKSIPFEIKEENLMPNKRLLKSLKEAEEIIKNPEKYKSYSLEEIHDLLIAEEDDKYC